MLGDLKVASCPFFQSNPQSFRVFICSHFSQPFLLKLLFSFSMHPGSWVARQLQTCRTVVSYVFYLPTKNGSKCCSLCACSRNRVVLRPSTCLVDQRICYLLTILTFTQCTDFGKHWLAWRDIIYLDSFNGVSWGFSEMVYFLKLKGKRRFTRIWLVPLLGNECTMAGWTAPSVEATS